jgi:hypothetical protein
MLAVDPAAKLSDLPLHYKTSSFIYVLLVFSCLPVLAGGGGGGDFGPKYQAHVGELQRQLDEARAALEAKEQQLAELSEERQVMADELSMLKGMGGGGGGGGAGGAGSAAAELAALNLSGGDAAAMKAVEQRINAVLAEKAAAEAKLARVEAAHAEQMSSIKAVRGSTAVCAVFLSVGAHALKSVCTCVRVHVSRMCVRVWFVVSICVCLRQCVCVCLLSHAMGPQHDQFKCSTGRLLYRWLVPLPPHHCPISPLLLPCHAGWRRRSGWCGSCRGDGCCCQGEGDEDQRAY